VTPVDEVTILDRLDRQARERGDQPAVCDPRGDAYDAWDTLTWAQYRDKVAEVARAFVALGHQPGDAVCIIGPNRAAWVLADLAAMAAGGMPAGIYPTSTAEQAEYIIQDAGASVVVVCDAVQAEKVLSRQANLPKLKAVVLFPGATPPAQGGEGLVYRWEEALARAEETPKERLDELRRGLESSGAATLIYTSGTTGPPKGVVLTHHNLMWTAKVGMTLADTRAGDRCLSYLPMAHIAEQMMTIHGPITIGATAHFVPVLEHLPVALAQVRPHFLFGVPRVFEKIQAKVQAAAASAPPMRQKLLAKAQRVGLPVMRARYEGKKPGGMDALLWPLFDRLVYSKFRARLGLDEARFIFTGAAPMSPGTRDWFFSMGVPISEVYGQSEDCGPTSFNVHGAARLGTVGKPVPGTEVKIAPDGEILVRGPNVFKGYLNKEEATQEALQDGWLMTGDVGELDADGFLRLTDRKKDLIITAGGKNIAPQNIEKLLREIDLVSQAVVIGDQRKYLSALITLVPEKLEAFCQAHGVEAQDPRGRTQHPKVREAIQTALDRDVNPQLARYETVKRFEILERELSEEAGELTPTMKIKRKPVNEHFAALIESMYA
jgi:long-chain acyl-CoA synthetase